MMENILSKLISNQSFKMDSDDCELCKKIIVSPFTEKEKLMKDFQFLWRKYDLGLLLKIVYLQQLQSGFILANPLDYSKAGNQKRFYDSLTGIHFLIQWNPERALRKKHQLLIQRGIIQDDIDKTKLVNLDKNGIPCYLCKENIDLQNPKEVVIPVKLGGEQFYLGANFASISDNHFTIFNQKHRPQEYRKDIFRVMMDFLNQCYGSFRIIYNGLAGASIQAHEHFQTTSICFPIESINYSSKDYFLNSTDLRIIQPKYYLPLWIVEGTNQSKLISVIDYLIRQWHLQKPDEHTENILGVRINSSFRFFIFLRERKMLRTPEHTAALATFEMSGLFVFSEFLKRKKSGKSEKDFFSLITLDIIKNMLKKIAPVDNLILDNEKMLKNI